MYYSKKLTYIVRSVYGAKVEDLLAIAKVYAAVLHRARVTTAGGIYGKGITLYYRRQSIKGKGRSFSFLLHIGISR